jgi:hypothetical protein
VSPAELARKGSPASNPMMLGFLLALLVGRHSARKSLLFDVLKASVVIGELGIDCFFPIAVERSVGTI